MEQLDMGKDRINVLVRQILESTYIISTSNIVDTVVSRYSFILRPVIELSGERSSERYLSDVQPGIDSYRKLYYDRILTEEQMAIIVQPSLQLLQEYYMKAVLKLLDSFLFEQEKVLMSLKKRDAIIKRLEFMYENIDRIKRSLSTIKTIETDSLFNSLEKLCINIDKQIVAHSKLEE
jgi:hypothetical protein